MIQGLPTTDLSATIVGDIVRQALAPVFLLSGIGAFVNVCTSRLSRIVDRSRQVEPLLLGSAGPEHDRWLGEMHVLDRRMALVSWAITLSVLSAVLTCVVVSLLFAASLTRYHFGTAIALLFIGSMYRDRLRLCRLSDRNPRWLARGPSPRQSCSSMRLASSADRLDRISQEANLPRTGGATMRFILFGASLIALSTPALSANASPVAHKAAPKTVTTKSVPDMSAVFAMFDKLFPPQPDPDPARLTLARTSAAAMWPNGAYGTMATGMMSTIFDRVMQMKASDLPGEHVKTDATAGQDPSLHTLATMKDPYFDQRTEAMRAVVREEAGKVSAIIDPRIRDGLARSMARRFDEHQLADINAFFSTPSGHALATQYMQMWVDPDMMRSIFTAMPEMMKLMPDMMAKVKAAGDKYPMPSKPAAKGKS